MKAIELDSEIVTQYSATEIHSILEGIDGVLDVSVITATQQLFVYCEDGYADAGKLSQLFDLTVKSSDGNPVGSEAKPKEMSDPPERPVTDDDGKVLRILVTGMHCAGCVGIVNQALLGVRGVLTSQVSLVTGQAIIRHAGASLQNISAVLHRRGYEVQEITSPQDVLRRLRKSNEKDQKTWRRRCGIAAVVVCLLLATMVSPIASEQQWWISIVLATFAQIWVGGVYVKNAVRLAMSGNSNMDTLIALGTSAAFVGGILFGEEAMHLLMDAPMILTFVSVGKWIEVKARQSTVQELSAVDVLESEVAHVVDETSTRDVPVFELGTGDRIVVRPGELIPADGRVVHGDSSVNQAWLTGESVPKTRRVGDRVYGGSINGHGLLEVLVDVEPGENRLHQMTQMLERSLRSQVPLQTLADSIVRRFVPILLLIASGTFCAWVILGDSSSSDDWQSAWHYTVAVLVIACPCALGLATPVALLIMSLRSVQEGVLFGNPSVMESLGSIGSLILDKTGTITDSEVSVDRYIALDPSGDWDEIKVIQIASALERQCNHPLAQAIIRYGVPNEMPALHAEDVHHEQGHGISGTVDKMPVSIGTRRYVRPSPDQEERLAAVPQGATCILINHKVVAAIEFSAKVHAMAAEDIRQVRELLGNSLEVALATGDHLEVARRVGQDVGIEEVHAEMLPEDKVKLVELKQSNGHVVAMVGDGINDTTGLVAADIGIAVAQGADLASGVADIVLLKPGLDGISKAIRLSKMARKIILQNIGWAFLYNVTLIPVAAGCFAGFGITIQPLMAAAAMALSSLFVVFNSLRLRTMPAR